MPVYNGERFIREALDSVFTQSFADFELLVINDGSTDDSAAIVHSYSDSRLRLMHNEINLGLIATLNKGLDLARGEYIMRMDCDDVSLPDRLARQVAFMDAHPEVGVCGVWYREFGEGVNSITRCAPDHASIKCGILFNPVVGHASVIMRKSAFVAHNLHYQPGYEHAEDYELWMRALKCFRFANLPELLLLYRVHAGQVTRFFAERQMDSAGKVRRLMLRELGIDPDDEEFDIHQMLSALTRPFSFNCQNHSVSSQLEKIDRWLCKLKVANDRTRVYPEPHFSRMLVERWVGVCCLNFIARGNYSSQLIFPPALYNATGRGFRDAFIFTAKRLGYEISDLLYRGIS